MSVPWTLDDGSVITLLTPEELTALPNGTIVISISGDMKTVGEDKIDQDTRFGHTAFGLLFDDKDKVKT